MPDINPLVSIGIPTYNNGEFIAKTLHSLLNQTYQNIEIIVSDNASTDDTEKIAARFHDSRLKYFRSDVNIGCANNFNKCLKLSSGDYITIYHSDDIYEPQIVECELNFLLQNPKVYAVFSLDTPIDKNDNIIAKGVTLPKPLRNKNTYNFDELYKALLRKSGSFLVCPTFMTRRSLVNELGLFDESSQYGAKFGGAEDLQMYLRIAEKHEIGIIPQRLIRRRITVTQGSTKYENTRTSRANHFLVLDSFLSSPALKQPVDNATLREYNYNKFWDDIMIAKNLSIQGNRLLARQTLIHSISAPIFFTGFRSFKNIVKMCFFLLLLTSFLLGYNGNAVIKLMEKTAHR